MTEPPSPKVSQDFPTTQTKGVETSPPASSETALPASGRTAFRDIRRELSEQDLASPGVQKLILEELERAEARCEILNGYVERFHDADKRAAILEEKNRFVVAMEVVFGVGVGLGCLIIGSAPLLWTKDHPLECYIALTIGAVLVVGASIARVVKQ